MATSTNVKVGITVTVFLIALAALSIWVSQYRPGEKAYVLEGRFDNVAGLIEGAKVHFLGVRVGTVVSIVPELTQVKVFLKINDDIKIPRNTILSITSTGFVGDKVVDFFVDKSRPANAFYKPGDVIAGSPPVGMNDLIEQGKEVMEEVEALLTDPVLNKSIRATTQNVELFTERLNSFLIEMDTVKGDIDKLAASTNRVIDNTDLLVTDIRLLTNNNRENINDIIYSAKELTENMNRVSSNLNDLIEDPNTTSDIKLTFTHIRRAADSIEHIARQAGLFIDNANLITADIQGLTGDEEVAGNIKDFIKNTKVISETFAKTLSTAPKPKDPSAPDTVDPENRDRFSAEFKNEFLGALRYQFNSDNPPTFGMVGNINVLAHTGVFSAVQFVKIGLDEIGENNLLNLQLGFYPFNNLRTRFGLVRGKLGLGSNYLIPEYGTELVLEAYDIAAPQVRLGILQNVYQNYGVSLYWNNKFADNFNEIHLGIRWQPGIF